MRSSEKGLLCVLLSKHQPAFAQFVQLFGEVAKEAGAFEQTYKISEFDMASEEDVIKLLDDDFMAQALSRFNEMAKSLAEAANRHE